MGPGDLAKVLAGLPTVSHPDLLVGTSTCDDAGVRRALAADRRLLRADRRRPYEFGRTRHERARRLCDGPSRGPRSTSRVPARRRSRSRRQRGGWRRRTPGALVVGGTSLVDEEIKFGIW
jgi:hypothetical protein